MRIISYTLYLLLFTLPFTLRFPVFSFIPGFHEYETIFIGLYDIILILFLGLFFVYKKITWQKYYWLLIAFLLFGLLSVLFSPIWGLSLYGILRVLLFSVFALCVGSLIHDKSIKIKYIFLSLFFSSLVQGLIGVLQFKKQGDLGLWFLGEQNLPLNGFGVSTVIIEGGKILRAYGTLPHPNILGFFLIVGFLSGLYWFSKIDDSKKYLFFSGMFIISLALFITLSRGALISFLFGIFFYFVLKFWKEKFSRKNIISLFSILFLVLFSLIPVYNFVLPRANISKSEIAVTSRLSYIEIGKKVIEKNLLGVGLKNQVYYTYENNIYKEANMNYPWEWQPIHNLYLLIASEIGVLGFLSFIVFIFIAFIKKFFVFLRKKTEENYIIFSILGSVMVYGLFDHFLWTIDSPSILLWLTIGLLL